ncbi:unnamed protein product [Hydatigera taeniaeformis]|uniref:DUF3475 domain-containing protein n=1 Tax=Hydatigena taeniaeformis TaxID=6205 RepID=A0A0R3WR55_HYDTA|nr:unnamed protein product [Hydatigera taeniaeformis]
MDTHHSEDSLVGVTPHEAHLSINPKGRDCLVQWKSRPPQHQRIWMDRVDGDGGDCLAFTSRDLRTAKDALADAARSMFEDYSLSLVSLLIGISALGGVDLHRCDRVPCSAWVD